VTEDSRRVPSAPCPGDPHNCELLLSSQEAYRERFGKAEISGHEAVVSAMAAGLVIDVWRNGPVEDMHCGKRGPDDAAMFAESTALHHQAVTALTADNRPIGLLEFEDHLLDRERPWAGTGGKTLKDLGYGFLGQYRRHVKDHINRLLDYRGCPPRSRLQASSCASTAGSFPRRAWRSSGSSTRRWFAPPPTGTAPSHREVAILRRCSGNDRLPPPSRRFSVSTLLPLSPWPSHPTCRNGHVRLSRLRRCRDPGRSGKDQRPRSSVTTDEISRLSLAPDRRHRRVADRTASPTGSSWVNQGGATAG